MSTSMSVSLHWVSDTIFAIMLVTLQKGVLSLVGPRTQVPAAAGSEQRGHVWLQQHSLLPDASGAPATSVSPPSGD